MYGNTAHSPLKIGKEKERESGQKRALFYISQIRFSDPPPLPTLPQSNSRVFLRVPLLIVGGLLLAGERRADTIDSAFFYGRAQVMAPTLPLLH